jgi:hypothetical protein
VQGAAVDASNAIGVVLGSSTTLSIAGSKVATFKNNATTVGSIDPSGFMNALPLALTSVVTGAGVTLGYNGDLRRGTFKITLNYTNWITAGLTQSITLAVIPAKCSVKAVIADTTAAYTNGVSTLALTVGPTGTLAGYIASHDVKTAVVTKGLADADMGSLLTRAAAGQPWQRCGYRADDRQHDVLRLG